MLEKKHTCITMDMQNFKATKEVTIVPTISSTSFHF